MNVHKNRALELYQIRSDHQMVKSVHFKNRETLVQILNESYWNSMDSKMQQREMNRQPFTDFLKKLDGYDHVIQ